MKNIDSLIFDMDGTLWDAVDSYVQSWNEGAKIENIDRVFTRADLDHVMGWERGKVLPYFFPDKNDDERERIYETINQCRAKIIPQQGGILYEGVREGIKKLASKYKLFVVSNCPKGLIIEFMTWAGLQEYFVDEMAHGVNSKPKSHNIKLLIDKHNLLKPVYIGDTNGDSIDSRAANVPFVLVTYGFGNTDDFDLKFDDFNSLTDYYMNL
ncbi:MAG: HAD family hydrolase [Daejeonella sp.]|uniref:HAD family hydrolase n=1 Tax=Daejeonella sp. TaxID=2805397 RepID=UPI003C7215DC